MEKGHPMEASGLSRRSRMKPLLATAVTLLLVAVAVCAVVAAFSTNTAPSSVAAALPGQQTIEARSLVDEPQPAEDETFEADDSPDSETPRVRIARYLKIEENDTEDNGNNVDSSSHVNTMFNTNPSCFSDISNKTVPAAHITGKGRNFRPSTDDSRNSYPYAPTGYQQMWKCTEIQTQFHRPTVHAFVDGGMCFNQTDKTLGVPKCGYYMITSQILFNMKDSSQSESRTVYHLMKFKRNCGSHSIDPTITVTGKSTVGPYTAKNYHAGVVTTITSDVIKLCAGGKVWIEIPDGDNGIPCCPTGDAQGTFITAVLVRESTCHWPPDTRIRYLDNDNNN